MTWVSNLARNAASPMLRTRSSSSSPIAWLHGKTTQTKQAPLTCLITRPSKLLKNSDWITSSPISSSCSHNTQSRPPSHFRARHLISSLSLNEFESLNSTRKSFSCFSRMNPTSPTLSDDQWRPPRHTAYSFPECRTATDTRSPSRRGLALAGTRGIAIPVRRVSRCNELLEHVTYFTSLPPDFWGSKF